MGKVTEKIKSIKENFKKIKTIMSDKNGGAMRFKKSAAIWKTIKVQAKEFDILVEAWMVKLKTKTITGPNGKLEKINKFKHKYRAFADKWSGELEKRVWQ